MTKRKITLIKKRMADGTWCPKCGEIEQRLKDNNQMQYIDQIIIADENDPESEGMQIAEKYEITRAPFFLIEEPNEQIKIYTVYLKFVKEILKEQTNPEEEINETFKTNPDHLDWL